MPQTKTGYCLNCKKITQWIKHSDFSYYICATTGCYNRSKNPEKEKSLEIQYSIYI